MTMHTFLTRALGLACQCLREAALVHGVLEHNPDRSTADLIVASETMVLRQRSLRQFEEDVLADVNTPTDVLARAIDWVGWAMIPRRVITPDRQASVDHAATLEAWCLRLDAVDDVDELDRLASDRPNWDGRDLQPEDPLELSWRLDLSPEETSRFLRDHPDDAAAAAELRARLQARGH